MHAGEPGPPAGIRRLARSAVRALAALSVAVLDGAAAWGLYGLGLDGLRAIGGWGMLLVGIVLVATAAANLLLLLVFVYLAAARQAKTISGQSQ